jgi:hypothetical protein
VGEKLLFRLYSPLNLFFRTLTANIRMRRGSKVAINLPLFIDEKVPRPFIDPTIPWDRSIYPEDAGLCLVLFMRLVFDPMSYLFQRPRMARHFRITFTWMPWDLEWGAAVYN